MGHAKTWLSRQIPTAIPKSGLVDIQTCSVAQRLKFIYFLTSLMSSGSDQRGNQGGGRGRGGRGRGRPTDLPLNLRGDGTYRGGGRTPTPTTPTTPTGRQRPWFNRPSTPTYQQGTALPSTTPTGVQRPWFNRSSTPTQQQETAWPRPSSIATPQGPTPYQYPSSTATPTTGQASTPWGQRSAATTPRQESSNTTLPSQLQNLTLQLQSSSQQPRAPDNSNIDKGQAGDNNFASRGILRTRPTTTSSKAGSSGNKVTLTTNYYKFVNQKKFVLYQHQVVFKPETSNRDHCIAALRAWNASLTPQINYIYNGAAIMYSSTPVKDITFFHRDSNGKFEDVHLYIRLVKEIEQTDEPYLQVYNVLVKKLCRMLQLSKIRDKFYDPNLLVSVQQYKLDLYPGFAQAIANHDSGLLLCVDPIFKVVRQETVLEKINEIKAFHRDKSPEILLKLMKDEFVGKIVMTTYKQKTFRVDDIDVSQKPTDSFCKSGSDEKISFKQYFKSRYGSIVQFDNQPMLVSHPTKWEVRRGRTGNKYLIPELCHVTGLSDAMRANFQLMSALNVHLQAPPTTRVKSITDFVGRIHASPQIREELDRWGLNLDKNLLRLEGRLLSPQDANVLFKDKPVTPNEKGDFTQAFRGTSMLQSVNLNRWAAVAIEREERDFENIVRELQGVARPINFQVSNPLVTKSVRPTGYRGKEIYRKVIQEIMAKYGKEGLQMIFIVLPNKTLDNYAAVKEACYGEYGILSQCMISKNVKHRNPKSICTKIAIQMNAKLGGEPWGLQIPLSDTMYVGFDVYHSADRMGPSIGAMAATMNKSASRYYSNIQRHATSQEISDKIFYQLAGCLVEYKRINGKLPTRILFYRDGVGEGQLDTVFKVELSNIRKHLTDLYKDQNSQMPRLVFIVVTKRISTRFFVQAGQHFDNPRPGTIVDSAVTKPESLDFFLVSQDTRQGTVSPTHYNILSDDGSLPLDRIQLLTYKLCFGYFNWSGSLSVPAPCQYAHKLAYLTGMINLTKPQEGLQNRLYYL